MLGEHRRQHASHGAGFAGARTALKQHQAVLQHRRDGPLLVRIQPVAAACAGTRIWELKLGPLDQCLQHLLALALPAAPQQPVALQHQGTIRPGSQG